MNANRVTSPPEGTDTTRSKPALAGEPVETAARTLRHKDLLGIADLSPEEILLILDTAEAMKEIGFRPIKKVPTLRGKTIVNLFFEASTRTRTSFEIAEKRLSADTLNIAASTSSVQKGETLADTALNLEAMAPDMIVLAARVVRVVSLAVPYLSCRHHQCRRRHARAPDTGIAGCVHDPRTKGENSRSEGRHHR